MINYDSNVYSITVINCSKSMATRQNLNARVTRVVGHHKEIRTYLARQKR
jgi:hypothetical protein